MIERFIQFIRKNKLVNDSEKTLLGISGGADSMVMADIFLQSGIVFSIAHCNFQLRGSDSDKDELLVRNFAKTKGIEFFSRKMETREYSDMHKISIQMAARELRINFFEELCRQHQFGSFATAHHQDDVIETFFINLIRGTGISGLHGILPKQGLCIHPMLFTNRFEIRDYARQKAIAFREDQSNFKTKYTRNKIRHDLIPVFKAMNPAFSKVMMGNIERLAQAEKLYQQKIEDTLSPIISKQGDQVFINKSLLISLDYPDTYLYEALKIYGFNFSDVNQLIDGMLSESGRQFLSKTHRLVDDREFFIITFLLEEKQSNKVFRIVSTDKEISQPIPLSIQHFSKPEHYTPDRDAKTACIDHDKLHYPLILRRWEKGDWFIPLGMQGRKLLSDLFTDLKLSIPQKEKIFILQSGKDIVWVIGLRIDNRYKTRASTKNIVRFTMC